MFVQYVHWRNVEFSWEKWQMYCIYLLVHLYWLLQHLLCWSFKDVNHQERENTHSIWMDQPHQMRKKKWNQVDKIGKDSEMAETINDKQKSRS
jgi:hypothetical protein